ncbi:AAA family ATPase [Moraxella osloensis]
MGKIAVDKIINGLITRKVCVMHLDSLKIKNFRILEDVTIEKLGHVNLIVGKNNSGKSTVLEALALLASGFNPEVMLFISNNRNVYRHLNTKDIESKVFSIENIISKSNEDPFLNWTYIGNQSHYLTFGYVKNGKNNNLDIDREKGYSFTYFIDDRNFMNFEVKAISNRALFMDMSENSHHMKKKACNFGYITTNNIDLNLFASSWDKIALTDDENLVLEMLKLIDSDITNLAFLSLVDSETRIPFVRLKNIERRIPLHQMGDGIFRLLQIILEIPKSKNSILLIDEFENGLHYSVQPKVWELIFELAHRFNIQVFATTHSWDCIESFSQVAKDRTDMEGVLFRMGHSVRKSDKGKLIATVFDEDDLYNLTKMNIEVR